MSFEEIDGHFQRPVRCLLGLPVDLVDLDEAVAFVASAARDRRHAIIATPNTNDLARARQDPAWRDAVLTSSLSIIDGMPLVWIGRLLGMPIGGRVAGANLFEALRAGRGGPLRVVFYGGPPGAADRARERVNAEQGPLDVVGAVNPGFGSVEDLGCPDALRQVNDLDPDLVILSLGQKGKPWVAAHARKIHRGVVTHLGAVVNFAAGTVRRAPERVQRAGLEWAWRIAQEPSLWRRYAFDFLRLGPILVAQVLPQVLDTQWRKLRTGTGSPGTARLSIQGASASITVAGGLDANVQDELRSLLAAAVKGGCHIDLDLSAARNLDSTAAGLLLLAYGLQRRLGRRLTLVADNPLVRRRLRWHGCDDLFPTPRVAPARSPGPLGSPTVPST